MFAAQHGGLDQRKRAREEEELANANSMSFGEHRNVSLVSYHPALSGVFTWYQILSFGRNESSAFLSVHLLEPHNNTCPIRLCRHT